MGSRFGPNYACLFVGHIEEQIFQQYRGKTPDLYKRYIDDIVGAASGTKEELEDFATFVNNFHPSLKFTWAISDDKLPFLDLYLSPSSNRLITTIQYKETDSHSYLNYSSSHPVRCKNSIPYSQFLRLRRICSEEEDFRTRSEEMTSFFTRRGYPPAVVNQALQRVRSTPSESTINSNTAPSTEEQAVPLVLTYHPRNMQVREIITRNFALLKSDPDTKDIF